MQTFLPDPDFRKSLKFLDYRRLGKQRVEAHQILQTLLGKSSGWINHPAVKMWRGYENALIEYFNHSIAEWTERGYKNSYKYLEYLEDKTFDDPYWLGDEKFHASHRSNLLRKFPEYYKQFEWTESDDLPYVWPEPKND